MEISNITVKFIVPSSGHTLTQSEDVKVEERIFSKKVWLGVNDSEKNWKEITDEEAEVLLKEQEALALEMEKKYKDDLS